MAMRVVARFAVLTCLFAAGFGIRLALGEQRHLLSYSATATATVIEKRLERHERPWAARQRPGINRSRFTFEPVVRYRYLVEEQQFLGANIFPNPVRVGGTEKVEPRPPRNSTASTRSRLNRFTA
jgi:hypothetical protein